MYYNEDGEVVYETLSELIQYVTQYELWALRMNFMLSYNDVGFHRRAVALEGLDWLMRKQVEWYERRGFAFEGWVEGVDLLLLTESTHLGGREC